MSSNADPKRLGKFDRHTAIETVLFGLQSGKSLTFRQIHNRRCEIQDVDRSHGTGASVAATQLVVSQFPEDFKFDKADNGATVVVRLDKPKRVFKR